MAVRPEPSLRPASSWAVRVLALVGRSPEKLAHFAESWAESPDIATRLHVMTWDELPAQLPKTGLVINATPLGMHPQVNQSPLSAEQLSLLPKGAIAYESDLHTAPYSVSSAGASHRPERYRWIRNAGTAGSRRLRNMD